KPRAPLFFEGLKETQISTTGIIDINLSDRFGQIRNLSDIKGKVILLDFTAYSLSESGDRIMQMRELYKKYQKSGFEIYQVSIDPNEHYWKTACEQLPWVCVYDPNGEESGYIRSYQIYRIPSYFLINKNGDLVARDEQVENLEESIKQLLGK
ncbi:MAG: TlpA family protein disulfide reductase, partial [Paraprevotella sp.]|nr:TlpA family protein disulfide reductase [Paraprevotella sp.]